MRIKKHLACWLEADIGASVAKDTGHVGFVICHHCLVTLGVANAQSHSG